MVELFGVVILVPTAVLFWVATAAMCHMVWKDFFRD